jgi:peptidoglycan/LPS O-acetylase OafA/YrhL
LSLSPWVTAARRGAVPVVLGILCFIASAPAIEDLDPLLKGLGAILVVLGLIVVVATGRTLSAEEKRIGPRV